MDKEIKDLLFKQAQELIDKRKEEVYKGEIDSSCYYPYVVGILAIELMRFYDKQFNTDLDLKK